MSDFRQTTLPEASCDRRAARPRGFGIHGAPLPHDTSIHFLDHERRPE